MLGALLDLAPSDLVFLGPYLLGFSIPCVACDHLRGVVVADLSTRNGSCLAASSSALLSASFAPRGCCGPLTDSRDATLRFEGVNKLSGDWLAARCEDPVDRPGIRSTPLACLFGVNKPSSSSSAFLFMPQAFHALKRSMAVSPACCGNAFCDEMDKGRWRKGCCVAICVNLIQMPDTRHDWHHRQDVFCQNCS
jgi:hypothetical protein